LVTALRHEGDGQGRFYIKGFGLHAGDGQTRRNPKGRFADHPLDSRLSFPEARFGKVRAKPTVASQ